ncbi:MAG: S41 family peptidase [Patescibacteria group bacterium]
MKEEHSKRLAVSRFLTVVAALIVFAAGIFVGSSAERSQTALDLSKFWRVYSLISENYPGEIDKDAAIDGAIRGLVGSLGDPYSSYLDEVEHRQLEEDLSGEFEGIGAILTQKDGDTVIVEPIEGSPAAIAGLQKDDVIIAVGDEAVAGQVLEDVVAKIRGPKGTKVTLTIQRGETELTIEIERGTITVESVKTEKRGNVGIIHISQFGDDTVEGVRRAIADLEKQNVTKYLIDLRNNPGGYLNTVAPVAGFFLPPGSTVVKQLYQGGSHDELRTTEAPLVASKPVYVFINGGSASASEILAGALQDHQRAIVLGEKSYGKGSVQDIINLRGSTALRLTIAEWITPNDRHISKVGIEPDQQIASDDDAVGLQQALDYIASR